MHQSKVTIQRERIEYHIEEATFWVDTKTNDMAEIMKVAKRFEKDNTGGLNWEWAETLSGKTGKSKIVGIKHICEVK